MDINNVVVVRGVVSSEPRLRELTSGVVVTQLDVTTRSEARTTSVPISVHDSVVDAVAGDEVIVTGHVNRRFFRSGGVTQSRTELIADNVVRTRRTRAAHKALATAVAVLAAGDDALR
jgi:single-strand DNA-binding protein